MNKFIINRLLPAIVVALLLSHSIVLFADETCNEALVEGKQKYNAGNYQKAKELFQFVQSECGISYGDAQGWINKCNEALTPRLSVSNSNLSFSASGGTQSITVSSNRSWSLGATNSQMFSVSSYGNTITVRCNKNTGTSSRNDYFIVQTTDGSKSIRINVSQDAPQAYLSVSKNSISCSSSGTTEYITVNSNTAWQIEYPSGTMYSVMRNGNTLTVKINANSASTSRSAYFIVKTTDGRVSQKISLTQAGRIAQGGSTNSTSSSSNTTASYLRVDKDYVSTSSYGTMEYITVSSNRSWEVKYPTGSMYSVTRSGNTLKVTIYQNNTAYPRSNFFYVQLTDGSNKQIKISLYQSANTSAHTSRSKSNSSYSTNHTYQSPYRKYINTNGRFEITWFGMGAGIGTGATFSMSAFRLRLGPVEFQPIDWTLGYDFMHDGLVLVQPTLIFLIPISNNWTTYFGGGSSIEIHFSEYTTNLWFKTEVGVHYSWGRSASSDFYLRYDGMFTVGATIQWATHRR